MDLLLEEALEDVDPKALPDPSQAGVAGEVLGGGVVQIPAMGQVQGRRLDGLAYGSDPLEEHDELELEKDDRVDTRPATLGERR